MGSSSSLPKLSPKETSITLLQEEEAIRPAYLAFELVLRRRFFHDALFRISELHALPPQLIEDLRRKRNLKRVLHADLNLNANLYLLSEYFKNSYRELIRQFKHTFPFVEEVRISNLSEIAPTIGVAANVPVFAIRERGSNKWVTLNELSSGMQKVLLILADIALLPEGSIYIIDEYENSLGVNAINFFPEFILSLEKDIQFFITSHHPYIINEIPTHNWYIFHRENMHVSIKYGEEAEERFGKSRQQAFIQLINDPFFTVGVQ
jgi:hypothetical protein